MAGRGLVNRGYLINPSLGPRTSLARREKDKSHTQTGIAPPWDAYGAPPGRRICAGDAPGRRIYAAAGGGRRRCGHSLPASAQIRVPPVSPHASSSSSACDECHSTGAGRSGRWRGASRGSLNFRILRRRLIEMSAWDWDCHWFCVACFPYRFRARLQTAGAVSKFSLVNGNGFQHVHAACFGSLIFGFTIKLEICGIRVSYNLLSNV
jgi:hypothetical protein